MADRLVRDARLRVVVEREQDPRDQLDPEQDDDGGGEPAQAAILRGYADGRDLAEEPADPGPGPCGPAARPSVGTAPGESESEVRRGEGTPLDIYDAGLKWIAAFALLLGAVWLTRRGGVMAFATRGRG